jgi:acid phosphatase family membrane protein YuiD
MLQRTSVTATSTLRTWGLCLAICCIACSSAVACMPATERGILFEHVPTDIDAPVIIEATVYDSSQVGDAAGNQMVVMNARVDRVIKGSIDAKTLKIFVYLGGCTRVGIGQGIVLGELRDDPQRGLMLEAIEGANMRNWSKEFRQRQEDILDAVRRDK